MEWENYWKKLIESKKLCSRIKEMNSVDLERGSQNNIESICHTIYDDYPKYEKNLQKVRTDILQIVEAFSGVHLQTSRIKSLDSVLTKVITKRHKYMLDNDNVYSGIDGYNYKNILTDLIGVRLIINYGGNWTDIHEAIIDRFPYFDEDDAYLTDSFIPHTLTGEGILAQIPIAYYAYGDNIDMYNEKRIRTELKENGYRSVHYVVSYENAYIEIQVRTIYDEAWSDCDHSYVYKHDENKSHTSLVKLSRILCKLTNLSNDLGEEMRNIYEGELIMDDGDSWRTTVDIVEQLDQMIERMGTIEKDLQNFRKRVEERGSDYDREQE